MTNFSGENLNAACGGPQGGGMDSRRNGVAEVSPKYLADVATNGIPVGYKQTEIGIIPIDWEVRTLEQLVAFRNGAAHENCIDDSGDYVVVNSKFISTEGLIKKGSKECRQPAYQSELLMVMSDVPNGRAIAKCYLVESNDTYTVNQRICALKSIAIEARFLFYKLNRNPFYLAFDDGAKQTNLRRQDVLDCPIPVPPKAEQTAIANALSDVDALISELEKLIAKKQAIKTATMQQLLTGRTRLPQFALREDGTPKGYKQTELGEVPEDWEVEVLTNLLSERPKYGINAPAVPLTGNLPVYIRITDISDDGYFKPSEKVGVNSLFSDQYQLNNGDLVVARTGASVGKSYFYKESDGALIYAGFLIKLSPEKSKLCPSFFSQFLKTHRYWSWVTVNSMRSGQPGINGNEYGSLPIILPAIEEQTAIATILSDMDAEIQGLEKRLNKTRDIKQGMMQELLTGRTRLI
jgi:type I restriction enzyme S subunit